MYVASFELAQGAAVSRPGAARSRPTTVGLELRLAIKAVLDRAVAGVLLMVLAPLFLVLAVAIRCTSTGPAFYRQIRVGRDGKPFRITKFRSMYVGAHEHISLLVAGNDMADGLLFKVRADPRVTAIGRFLRRTSLDELPQLVEVLTGHMSLVGPRPPLPEEVARYGADVRRRLLVKPGMTGLWQVSGRSDLAWGDAVRLDLNYVENWSLRLDLTVLLRTPRAVLSARGAY